MNINPTPINTPSVTAQRVMRDESMEVNAGDQTRDRRGDGRQSQTQNQPAVVDECDISTPADESTLPSVPAQSPPLPRNAAGHSTERGNHLDVQA